jgi:predicted nucleotidyltransferase component of viral defense system
VSKSKPTNLAASIRQRLLNLARDRKEEFQLVLVRYALERILYRLHESQHKNQFILKGAMLFQLWTSQPHRSTLDLDLLGTGDDAPARFAAIFREISALVVEEDGLVFPVNEFHAESIREDQRYGGVRVRGVALLGTARIPLQIDIGFGDVVTPRPEAIQYPSLIGLPTATFRAYPKETVVAEKFEAMVSLGIGNSRMKDFYDLWILASTFEFQGEILARAIQATFKRRGTVIPMELPTAFTADFFDNPSKQSQWQAFIRRGKLVREAPTLESVVLAIRGFLWPVVQSIGKKQLFNQKWEKSGRWR